MLPKILTPHDALQHLTIPKDASEHLWVLFLNESNQLIEIKYLATGTCHLEISPGEIFAYAFHYKSSGMIIVHNHPSGNSSPSLSDIEFTSRLSLLGKELGITILDNLICTNESYFSFFEEGLLQ